MFTYVKPISMLTQVKDFVWTQWTFDMFVSSVESLESPQIIMIHHLGSMNVCTPSMENLSFCIVPKYRTVFVLKFLSKKPSGQLFKYNIYSFIQRWITFGSFEQNLSFLFLMFPRKSTLTILLTRFVSGCNPLPSRVLLVSTEARLTPGTRISPKQMIVMWCLRAKHDGKDLVSVHPEPFGMTVSEVLGALCWDRHPFHASGVPIWERLGEIYEIQNTHTHNISQLAFWGLFLPSCDCRQIRLSAATLTSTSSSLLSLAWYDWSGGWRRLPSPLPLQEWRWLMCSGGRGGEEPGSSSAVAPSRDLRAHTKAAPDDEIPPSNDPHPHGGPLGGGRRKGLRQDRRRETSSGNVCLVYVATKLSHVWGDALGVMKTYSGRVRTQISGCNSVCSITLQRETEKALYQP